jgi:dTDP-4-dehydrorhamnose 3,5-epimerase
VGFSQERSDSVSEEEREPQRTQGFTENRGRPDRKKADAIKIKIEIEDGSDQENSDGSGGSFHPGAARVWRRVVRGLHYQVKQAQGKLVRVAEGEILDVAVDLRRSSPSFGKWEAVRLSAENRRMLWIPMGFAHGFSVKSEQAQVLYKATDFYAPAHERTLLWNDPQLKIDWQLEGDPIVSAVVSAKDQRGVPLRDAETFD